jgi:hypothetical protein
MSARFLTRPQAVAAKKLLGQGSASVRAVVEIDVVWKVVNTAAAQGVVLHEAGANRRQHPRIGPDLRVTGHAGFRGWNPSKSSLLDGCMAVAAVDPKLARMVGMTERDRLLTRNVLLSHVSRTPDLIP